MHVSGHKNEEKQVVLGRGISFKRLGHELLQFAVEHEGDFRHLGIAELAELRRRFVVFHTRLAMFGLIDEHSQRGVKAGPDVVSRHLESEQGISKQILDRLSLLAGEAKESTVIGGPEEHEPARAFIALIFARASSGSMPELSC
jgi:hypothetical protein